MQDGHGDAVERATARRRAGLLLTVLVVTSLLGVAGSLLWPGGSG